MYIGDCKRVAREAHRLKECPPTKKINKNIILHPLVQLHHLMTRVEMNNIVDNKRAKVMMTRMIMFESNIVLMVVKTSHLGEMKRVKNQMKTLNLSHRVERPLMRALHQVKCRFPPISNDMQWLPVLLQPPMNLVIKSSVNIQMPKPPFGLACREVVYAEITCIS